MKQKLIHAAPRDVNHWIGQSVNFLRRTGSLNMIYVTLHQLQRIAPVTQTFAIWLSSGWRVVRNKKCPLHNLEISLKILLSEPDLDTLREMLIKVFDSNQLWKLHFQQFCKINLTVFEDVARKEKWLRYVWQGKDSFLRQKKQF